MKHENFKFPLLCALLTILIVGVYADLARQPSTELGFTDLPIVKADDLPCIDDPLEAWSESELIIWQYNSSHYACRNMSTLMVHELADNLTRVEENALGNMTSGLLFLKEVVHNTSLTLEDDEIVIECYQGKYQYYSNLGQMLIPQLASDPSTAGWGATEQGRMWYNTAEGKIKFWDGTTIQVLPSVGGAPPGGTYWLPYEYTVFTNDTVTYYAEDKQGNIDFSGSDADTVINNAINALTASRTWIETVYLKGNISVNNPINVSSYTRLFLDGIVTLASGSDCNLIQNTHPLTNDHDVVIEGGIWNPNYAGNAAGHGIYWYQATEFSWNIRNLFIRNLEMLGADDDGIHLEVDAAVSTYPLSVYIDNVDCAFNTGYGLYIRKLADSRITNSFFECQNSDTMGTYISGSSCIHFSNCYFNGGVVIYESNLVVMSNFYVDIINRVTHGIDMQGSRSCQISNGNIHIAGASTTNNYNGISLANTGSAAYQICRRNLFSNIYIGQVDGGTAAHHFANGINETVTNSYTDYNVFTNMFDYDSVNGMHLTGSNSKITNSYNLTSWIS